MLLFSLLYHIIISEKVLIYDVVVVVVLYASTIITSFSQYLVDFEMPFLHFSNIFSVVAHQRLPH